MVNYLGETGGETLLLEGLVVGVRVVGKGVDADAAAGREDSRHLDVLGVHKADKVVEDDVDAVLVEIAVVAEREQIEFQRLGLHHALARDVGDDDGRKVRLPCFWAERGELGTMESDEILVFGVLVDESLKHFGGVIRRILGTVRAEKADALQFIRCSHAVFSFLEGLRRAQGDSLGSCGLTVEEKQ